MKALLSGISAVLFLAAGNFLQAQTNSPPQQSNPQAAREMKMISFLTPADQAKYAKARAQALEDNPELKAEGEEMMQKAGTVMTTGSAADRQAFMEEMNSHRQKLREAMLKEDPSLPPVFTEIDQHISQIKAKQLGAMQGSAGPTNAPSSRPTGQ